MFGLGFGEIVIILVLALILLGPQRLPEVAKQLGKGLREFKKTSDDLKQQFEGELYSEEAKTPPRPSLVPPSSPTAEPVASVESPAPSAPTATPENVPGLEAAMAETGTAPATPGEPPKPA